jgi:hypothetical protein
MGHGLTMAMLNPHFSWWNLSGDGIRPGTAHGTIPPSAAKALQQEWFQIRRLQKNLGMNMD